MRRTSSVLLLLALAGVSTAAACRGSSAGEHGWSTTGSAVFLEGSGAGRTLSGMNTDAPATIVFGTPVLINESGVPLTLRSGTLQVVGTPSAGADVDEVRVLDLTTRHDLVGVVRADETGFTSASEPLDGFRLDPGKQVQVLYFVTVHDTGRYTWDRPTVSFTGPYGEGEAVSQLTFDICPNNSGC